MSDKSNNQDEEYKPYTARRWTDIPQPVVIGHREFTEEEKKENDKKTEKILKEYGIIGENDIIRDGKVIKQE